MAKYIRIVNKLKKEEMMSFFERVDKKKDIEWKSTSQDNLKVEKELNYMSRSIEQMNAPNIEKISKKVIFSETVEELLISGDIIAERKTSPLKRVSLENITENKVPLRRPSPPKKSMSKIFKEECPKPLSDCSASTDEEEFDFIMNFKLKDSTQESPDQKQENANQQNANTVENINFDACQDELAKYS